MNFFYPPYLVNFLGTGSEDIVECSASLNPEDSHYVSFRLHPIFFYPRIFPGYRTVSENSTYQYRVRIQSI